jgi:hypothetical protein
MIMMASVLFPPIGRTRRMLRQIGALSPDGVDAASSVAEQNISRLTFMAGR